MDKLNFSNLENAYNTLNKSYQDYLKNQDSILLEYICDSCVKRFEYTLETAWKFMRKLFIQKYGKTDQELTMNNIFRFMKGYGFANDWLKWKSYYQKRNETAHEYNIEKSRQLLDIIPDFLEDAKYLIDKLKEKDNNEY